MGKWGSQVWVFYIWIHNRVRQGRQGGKVDKEEESSTIQTYEDLIIFYEKSCIYRFLANL